MTHVTINRLLFSILFIETVGAHAATQLYNRWTDEAGHVHYSDQINPEDAKHGRNRLDKHGYVVETVDAVKTGAEIHKEKQLRLLRAEKKRLLAVQKDRDRALLRSFKNTSELEQTLQKNLNSVDVSVRITQSNIQQLTEKIKDQQKKAARYELKGQIVPARLLQEIKTSNKQLDNYQLRITSLETDKTRIQRKFARDSKRFNQLISQSKTKDLNPSFQLKQTRVNNDLSLFTCKQDTDCQRAWKLAKMYLIQHATTRLQIDTERLLYTKNPRKEKDVSLSVSKIINRSGLTQLFLDVRCKPSSIGRELCLGSKTKAIRSGFVPFIREKLFQEPI